MAAMRSISVFFASSTSQPASPADGQTGRSYQVEGFLKPAGKPSGPPFMRENGRLPF
jgi:hypothetical protein